MTGLDRVPSCVAMWRACMIAPAATPLALIAMLASTGVVLPAAVIAVGIVTCYLVAVLIGMPIAFVLRSRNALNGYTIHGAAFCWGVLSTVAWTFHSIRVAAAIGGTWDSVELVAARYATIIIPPVVLAGTAFWLLLRMMPQDELGTSSDDGASFAASEAKENNSVSRSAQVPGFC